jgi:hypothetical protein
MNTDRNEFYEDTLLQIGHIGAETSQLISFFQAQELTPSVTEHLKAQMVINEQAVIEELRIAEEAITNVRKMAAHWVATASWRRMMRPWLPTSIPFRSRRSCIFGKKRDNNEFVQALV